jgi:hypothetical protein
MDFKEMPYEAVDWIHLAKIGVQWRDRVNTAVTLRIFLGNVISLIVSTSCDRNDRLKFVNWKLVVTGTELPGLLVQLRGMARPTLPLTSVFC